MLRFRRDILVLAPLWTLVAGPAAVGDDRPRPRAVAIQEVGDRERPKGLAQADGDPVLFQILPLVNVYRCKY